MRVQLPCVIFHVVFFPSRFSSLLRYWADVVSFSPLHLVRQSCRKQVDEMKL